VGAPETKALNVAEPTFLKGLETVLGATKIEDLRAYLRWHLLRESAPFLPRAFVDEDFAFYGKVLTGAKQIQPRWKRCVQYTDSDLGEALGKRFVELTYGEEGRQRMAVLVAALEKALEEDIRKLDWMTEATKKQAQAKLSAMANKIGHPENWRDYSSLTVRRDDAFGNSRRANAFELARQLAKIGRPIDRQEWLMSPPTVNAYYNPLLNDINFPAGILQPPFFDREAVDAQNLGAIGAVIGHELTHGFDDQGRQFGPTGKLEDWWSEADAKEFERRAQCFVDQFGAYPATGEVKLNGRLSLGENVADGGGMRIAYMALQSLPPAKPEQLAGFTSDQRFFLGWAQVWCEGITDESARLQAQTDPHALARWRVNGVAQNMPEFRAAFSCPADAPMVRKEPCRVW
jgi:endothelin-converting enzyme/putative endopeptidase